ncbi:MAG: type IV toxin-antitoxin system AbiEi family antitoxin [Ignavibacteria bacterium]|nr:type IV toxin-antitoxin system AbiEi family antitoxin [Ignavibacteria bacterium]
MVNISNKNIDFIEFNLKNGRKTFSYQELVNYKGGNKNAAKQYIKYCTGRKLIKNLSEGFYAVYSPSEKDSGNIQPADFINQLMNHKNINYYTGLLSAASFYGAVHFRPFVYQVIVDKQIHTPKKILEGINFHKKKYFPEYCIIRQKGNYGYINYSSPTLTAYDLIKYENESGTIGNIVLIISDMLSQIKISDIKNLLKNNLEITYIQRLGYILEKLGGEGLINSLFEYSKMATAYIPLSRLGNKSGNRDVKWKIIENINWKDFIAP